ncbi:asparagine synthase (glutamine-hydrolyzing) [Xylocopilactobacillus apis]|uniref:asparagine synthase (glutamine-hydrolyzing) n=1 Tax=Xylocopilactobacillus apis TaxID=2932183 RepID=A0AAU9CTG6_9LACO|nr:asparagine synthase (glutamine-hydrolyzing) [Xylocopilactobacillus apis]BDR55656.1 asparagine synthetase B [Xylocopilactobacillus apis]
MCGIIAFCDRALENKEEVLTNMMNAIKHRGPNSSGQYINDDVALGFRRLSIIDLRGGSQPIFNEDGEKAIIFNGEIYNFKPLRKDLITAGHTFTTKTDTEVLLHGFEEWGMEGLLKKIRGMFAFIIWDNKEKKLYGARDFFGIKPMYYYQDGDRFLVGSEIKSFLYHPYFKKELNKKALKPYLTFQYSALEETFFKNVFSIPGGHYFTFQNGKLDVKQYWDMKFEDAGESFDQTVKDIENIMNDSVEAHKISDVPVGSLLSSGIDSSYITSLSQPEHTFSVGFDDKKYNEAIQAKELAQLLGLNNESEVVTSEEAFNNFPLIQYYMDEPDANPSCVPLYFLTKLASKYVTVILSGEGADELFAGYVDYGYHSHSRVIKTIGSHLRKLKPKTRYRLANRLKNMPNFHGRLHLYESTARAEDFFIGEAKIFGEKEADSYLKEPYKISESVKEIVSKSYDKVTNYTDEVKKMQYLDIHLFMAKDILLKADKMSMANSMELRVPFLDKEVAKVASKVPTRYLLTPKNSKYALRVAAEKHLPEEWVQREKLGFPVPVKAWLENDDFYTQIRNLFEQDFVKEFFDVPMILDLIDRVHNGDAEDRRKVWTIYTFLVWYKVYFIDEKIPTYVTSK